jgi:hypothetical protein
LPAEGPQLLYAMAEASIAPHAAKFGLNGGDGVAVLDHLLTLAHYPDKEQMVATTGCSRPNPRSKICIQY